MRRFPALLVGAIVVALAAACTGDDPEPAPDPTGAAPSASALLLTPGTSVDLTATVARVLGARAFLVADTDLPPDGQVVVSDQTVEVRVTDVVTVAGRVEKVDRAALARYGVSDPQVSSISGGLAVVATSVRRYLPESVAPTPGSPTPSQPAPTGSPG
ncbi:hypothetical protein O7627_31600 [Solwaraspora sp. WMMD1047]|uniref:hypothetical protein n=1 Tax=Solwaraspora sp. WMMD1047 TaxID=3016102 RepID=UPI002415D964|nr:hypothetical protein [Solwaraspora sp. WMMD1047]MDG4833824.1 hypothetical protein [Solwaraspora sp. WMMD1047]